MARPALRSDPAYKRLFSHARMVADLVRLLDAPWVDELDQHRLERLPAEHVADDLRKRLADMPWWVPFKSGGGRPAGAGALLQIEFQLAPNVGRHHSRFRDPRIAADCEVGLELSPGEQCDHKPHSGTFTNKGGLACWNDANRNDFCMPNGLVSCIGTTTDGQVCFFGLQATRIGDDTWRIDSL